MRSETESRVLNEGSFCSSKVKVQNKKRIVKALEKTDMKLTISAICCGPVAKRAKKAPII